MLDPGEYSFSREADHWAGEIQGFDVAGVTHRIEHAPQYFFEDVTVCFCVFLFDCACNLVWYLFWYLICV